LTEDEESDLEFESVRETDAERREALLKSDKDTDLSNKLGRSSSWKGLEQEFDFNNRDQGTSSNIPIDDIIDLTSDDDNDDRCNIAVASGSTFIHGQSNAAKGKGKSDPSDDFKGNTSSKARHPTSNAIGLGRMVKAEIDLRKKESLGMAPVKDSGRTLGSRSTGMMQSKPTKWDCLVCTLSVTFCYSISLGVVLIRVLLVRISQVICRALLVAHPVEIRPGHKKSKIVRELQVYSHQYQYCGPGHLLVI
jgi:DNA-dependent metalloprotease WSS1